MERIEKEVIMSNSHGLHARPAALFVQMAKEFDSSVMLDRNGEVVDGKSIIAILSLGVNTGMRVKLIVEGDDAGKAAEKLTNFLEKSND